jgi:hypothetical protein
VPTLELHAESLSDFISRVSEVEKSWSQEKESWGLWYRGHRKAFWPLSPTLYRELTASENARNEDDELREDFIKRAPSLTDRKPENPWEWYFLMQHYHVPTRLLDWTEGALIALYFAVNKNQGYHHACVWVLDPWWLNKKVVRVEEVIPPGSPGLSKADAKRYGPWLPDRFGSKTLRRERPVAVYPNYVDRRIIAQRSCFTIHGSRRGSLEKIFNKKEDRLAKVLIPAYKVADIKRELEMGGINEATVFPDLEGLGRAVTKNWLTEEVSQPHSKVYAGLAPSSLPNGGIGVFAIIKIPKGTLLFDGDNDEMLWIKEARLPKKPAAIRNLYRFAVIKNGWYGCPPTFNRLTMSWYLNHSGKPNVKCTPDYDFKVLKDIEPGTELTVDYLTYNDPSAIDFLKTSSKHHTATTGSRVS